MNPIVYCLGYIFDGGFNLDIFSWSGIAFRSAKVLLASLRAFSISSTVFAAALINLSF